MLKISYRNAVPITLFGIATTVGGWWFGLRLLMFGYAVDVSQGGSCWSMWSYPDTYFILLLLLSGPCILVSGVLLLNDRQSRMAKWFGRTGGLSLSAFLVFLIIELLG